MANLNLGSETPFEKALVKTESAQATLQLFTRMEPIFSGTTRLSKESFLVTEKLFKLKAFKQVIEFGNGALSAYLTTNDDPTRMLSAKVLRLMAFSFLFLNKYDDSLLYLNRAKTNLNKLLEDNNASALEISIDIHRNMSEVKKKMGNREEDVVRALNILKIKENTLEEGCVELGDVYSIVCDVYFRACDYESALLYSTKALEIYEKHLGKDNNASAVENLLDIHGKMYIVKVAIGNREDAIVHLVNILEIRRKTLEEDCVELGKANMSVTDAYLVAFDHESALPYCTKALEIYKKHLEDKDLMEDNNASAVETLFDIHRKMFTIKDAVGNRKVAVAHLSNILEIREKKWKEDCVRQLGDANLSLAETYSRAFDHTSAVPYYIKAVEIYEKSYGPKHVVVAFTYSILGAAYLALEQKEESMESLVKAKNILDVTHGENHLNSLKISHRLSKVYAALGRYNEAIQIEEKVVEGLQGMASSEQILDEAVKHLSDMKARDTESHTKASSSQSTGDAELAAKISKASISDEET